MRFFANISRFLKHKQAATAIEYALLAFILAIGSLAGYSLLGEAYRNKFACIRKSLSGGECEKDLVFTDFHEVSSSNRWSSGWPATGDTYGVGKTLEGWTVTSGSIDLVSGKLPWNTDGSQSKYIDLDGFSAGTISQSFKTIPGKTYILTFAHGANGRGNVQVTAGDASQNFTNSTAIWDNETIRFTATQENTAVSFKSLNNANSYGGSLLTNIKIKPNE